MVRISSKGKRPKSPSPRLIQSINACVGSRSDAYVTDSVGRFEAFFHVKTWTRVPTSSTYSTAFIFSSCVTV